MNIKSLIRRLEQNAVAIGGLAGGVDAEQARWKPSVDEWSLLEVTVHLYDEERADFRRRLDLTLHRPDQIWPPTDPAGWVTDRAYNERNMNESLAAFLAERTRSIEWLRNLEEPAWDNQYTHMSWGPISAGDLALSWVAHDSLHIRQMAHLHCQYHTAIWQPYEPGYAGEW